MEEDGGMMRSTAQAIICAAAGMTGPTSQTAVARRTTPKAFDGLHPGAGLGRSVPAESPTTRSGTPCRAP